MNINGEASDDTFSDGLSTTEIKDLTSTSTIVMNDTNIEITTASLLLNGAPIGGGGGAGSALTEDLSLSTFDITGTGFTLNGINTNTQNITAVSGTTNLAGGLVITDGTEQLTTISTTIAKDKHSCQKAGGVFTGNSIYQDLIYANDDTDSSNQVALIRYSADENHTATERGTDVGIWTVARGTIAPVERLSIDADGTSRLTGNLQTSLNTESKTYTEDGISSVLLKVKNANSYYAGVGAGASLTTAEHNVLIGDGAGSSITTDDFNIGIGNNALQYSDGNLNTAVGVFSQRGVSGGTNSGVRNTSLGANSLIDGDTTSSNVAVGYYAGGGMVSGLRNTLIGTKVNNSITDDGSVECIIIGNESRSGGGTNRCVIGDAITATKDNQVVLGNASVIEIINNGNGVCDLGSATNVFKNLFINQVNSLTPVGGVYSGLSDGALISGGTLGSLLPASGVGSLTIGANEFVVGGSYHLVCAGDIPLGDKDDVITITLSLGGVQLAQLSVDMEDNDPDVFFELEADFQVRSIGGSGSIISNFDFTFNKRLEKDFKGSRHIQLATIDTTSANVLTLTAQFAGQLNSTIQTRLFYLSKQY